MFSQPVAAEVRQQIDKAQQVFSDLEKVKERMKLARKEINKALRNSIDHQLVVEKYDAARREKKQLEDHVKGMLSGQVELLQELGHERAALGELLSDIAITKMLRGEQLALFDSAKREVEPVYKVTFRRR